MNTFIRIAVGFLILGWCTVPSNARWQWVPAPATDCEGNDAIKDHGVSLPNPALCSKWQHLRFAGKPVICWGDQDSGQPERPMCAYKSVLYDECHYGWTPSTTWVCVNH